MDLDLALQETPGLVMVLNVNLIWRAGSASPERRDEPLRAT
jgi:hypothetical protein